MEPRYSLAYLTVGPLHPPDAVSIAAEHGYACIGLRALPAAPGGDTSDFLTNPALVHETKARLKDTGVEVFDMEIIRIGPAFDLSATKPFFDLCGEFGARAILVAGDDADEGRFVQNYAAFCEAAAPYGLTGDLEFMPWTCVKDAKTAVRIVAATGQSNAGVLVDAIHANRSTTTLDDLKALPRSALHYVQMCDGPVAPPYTEEVLIRDARGGRLVPGEGAIDLVAMFNALPQDLPISLEVPNHAMREKYGVSEWCRMVMDGAKTVMKGRV